MPTLFDTLPLGRMNLANRVVMAPMTRGRASDKAVPNAMMAEYYGQRSSAGLIITEATGISPQGYGWVKAPGIWNTEQVEGWKQVTREVHKKGSKIFCQLWHMGRVVHPDFLDGALPVGPSAIAAKGETRTPLGKKAYVQPRAMTVAEIESTVADYVRAAKHAIQAGFDGVEIHAANGYLLDQFLRDHSNKRTDNYGGSTQNRIRFLIEVTDVICAAIGSDRVGVRLSPTNPYNDMTDADPISTFTEAAKALDTKKLGYLHVMEAMPGHMFAGKGEPVSPHIRKIYKGTLIANGGYTKALGTKAVESGEADAIAYGILFLANPDLVHRFKVNAHLNSPNLSTMYGPDEKGYTDYPTV